jgi:hypothetical protein
MDELFFSPEKALKEFILSVFEFRMSTNSILFPFAYDEKKIVL